MGIPCSLDPLGSGNAEPYKKGQILVEIANPQTTAEQVIDIPKPGVYQLWLVGGGNTTCWCYIGCNGPGSAAGFIAKMYFNTKCRLKLTVGALKAASVLQVSAWNAPDTWYNLVTCNPGNNASGGAGGGGAITVNRESTFNTYFDIELETKGNGGGNATSCARSAASSVYNNYGAFDVNGYGKLEYIRIRP